MEKSPSKFEQQVIDLYLQGISPYSMANMLEFQGYYPSSLDRILVKYGYKTRVPKRAPNSFEQDVIKKYQQGYSVPQIIKMEQFEGVTLSKVYSVLNKFKITCRSNKINNRIYKLNQGFFTNIDREEKAYWLGFIYADGYVTTRGNYVGLAIAQKDKTHLEKFVSSLQTNYPIKEYLVSNGYGEGNVFCRLIICSETVQTDLISKGVLTNKSLRLTFPSPQIVPMRLLQHFIRGYFDGDGSLSYYTSNNSKYFTIKICGTYELLDSMRSYFKSTLELNGSGSISKRKKDNKNNYYLTIGGNIQVGKVLGYLYKDATLYLDRKYLRYLFFLKMSSWKNLF
jgi:hypothetical protein